MHADLRGEGGGGWFLRGVGLPALVCLAVVTRCHSILPAYQDRWKIAIVLVGACMATIAGALFVLSVCIDV
jgi:hypothetical protein